MPRNENIFQTLAAVISVDLAISFLCFYNAFDL